MARRTTRRYSSRPRIGVRVTTLPERKPPEPPAEPFRPSLNAMLLLGVILLSAIWTWMYSDWFAVFSRTVGLTALLGVVPTVRGYMTANRNDRWGMWIDDMLFKAPAATRIYVIAIGVILVVGFGLYQPIAIRAPGSASADTVSVALFRGDSPQPMRTVRIRVEPDDVQRWPVRRPILQGPDRLVAKSSALPVLERDLSGLRWRQINYPFDFWEKPAVLLYPAPAVLADLRDIKHDLYITQIRNGLADARCLVQADYLGEPVWLGTGGRALPVSQGILTHWRDLAALYGQRAGHADLAGQVIATALAPACMGALPGADAIDWALLGADGAPLHSGRLPISGDETFPINAGMEATQ